MLKRILKSVALAAAALLSACSAGIDNYQSSTPTFDLFGYFEGETDVILQDRRLLFVAETVERPLTLREIRYLISYTQQNQWFYN